MYIIKQKAKKNYSTFIVKARCPIQFSKRVKWPPNQALLQPSLEGLKV